MKKAELLYFFIIQRTLLPHLFHLVLCFLSKIVRDDILQVM